MKFCETTKSVDLFLFRGIIRLIFQSISRRWKIINENFQAEKLYRIWNVTLAKLPMRMVKIEHCYSINRFCQRSNFLFFCDEFFVCWWNQSFYLFFNILLVGQNLVWVWSYIMFKSLLFFFFSLSIIFMAKAQSVVTPIPNGLGNYFHSN